MASTGQQKVSAAINTAILASIGTEVSDRVFDLKIPDTVTDLPTCRYQIIIDTNENMLNFNTQKIILQVDFFGKAETGIKALRDISDVLFSDLIDTQLTIDDVAISNVINGTQQGTSTLEEVQEEDIVRIRQEYTIDII